MLAIGLIVMASCQKASEKAAGNYTGSYIILSNTYSGTANAITSGDNVNLTLAVPSFGIASTANGVTATNSGDNVSLAFSITSTTNGTITSISGTLTGKSLAFSFTYYSSGSISGTFSGTKP